MNTLGRLRSPAYTGADRCLPCTTANLVLAGCLSAVVAATAGVAAATGCFLLGTAAVALRGYLLPGTPWLAPRVLPDRLGSWIHQTASRRAVGVAVLRDLGALAEGGAAGGLAAEVGPAVDATARSSTADGGSNPSRRTDPGSNAFSGVDAAGGGPQTATVAGETRRWPSRAALLADRCTDAHLARRLPRWSDLDAGHRLDALAALRVCRDRCPACEGTVVPTERTVETCCGTARIAGLECADCGARLADRERGRTAREFPTPRPRRQSVLDSAGRREC